MFPNLVSIFRYRPMVRSDIRPQIIAIVCTGKWIFPMAKFVWKSGTECPSRPYCIGHIDPTGRERILDAYEVAGNSKLFHFLYCFPLQNMLRYDKNIKQIMQPYNVDNGDKSSVEPVLSGNSSTGSVPIGTN